MTLRRPTRLHVQQLEDRSVPAVTTQLVSGILMIRSDNLSNTITLTETGTTGKFVLTNKVGMGATKTVGTFMFSNLNIATGNGNDIVDLRINSAITGNVTVTIGNGSDFFTTKMSAAGAPPTARIGGNVLLNLGLGNKLGVTALLGGQAYDQAAQFYNLKIGGGVTVLGTPGSGAELVDVTNSRIGGALQAVNIYQTSLGALFPALNPVFVGSVTVNNAQKNTDSRTDTFVGPGNDLFFLNNVTSAGSVTYIGGPGQDTVELPGDSTSNTPATIGGSVLVNTGDGPSTLSLGNGGAGSAQVAGSVQYQGGAGVDRFFLDTGASVAGNVLVSLGEGNNQVFGNSDPTYPNFGGPAPIFDPIGTGFVAGSLTIQLGNGNNYISTYGGGGTDLTVGGNLSIRLGNGNNMGGPAAAPTAIVTFLNTAVSVGGTVTYQAGTGTNNLTITNETIAKLRLIFSGGSTALLFNQASGTFNGELFIDFGTGFGPKSLGGTAAFGGMTTILNY